MMKMRKWMGKSVALLMAVMLIVTLLPVHADAAVKKNVPVLCYALDDAGDVVDMKPGIPILSGSSLYMITDDEFYQGNYIYATILKEDDVVELEYGGEFDGFALFSFEYSDSSVCAPEGQSVIGEKCITQAMNSDVEIISNNATITDYDPNPTETEFYWITVDTDLKKSSVLAPVAILNAGGQVVAIMGEDGNISFSEPEGGSSGRGNSETEAPPSRNTTPETTEEEPPATTQKPDKPDNPGNDDRNKYLLPIIGAVALIVLAIVVVLILRRPKPGPVPPVVPPVPPVVPPVTPPDGNGGVTMPIPPQQPGSTVDGTGGWQPVNTGASLVDTCGVLGGRTFVIPREGAVIGRALEATINYPKDTKGVSRQHCRIYWQGNALMLMDLGSTSGTYVLGKGQLRTNTATEVNNGDVICLGSKKISLRVQKN